MSATPGPWRVTPYAEGSCQLGVGQYVQDNAGNHVAYAARSQADARLIAAAPELLWIARDILGFFNLGQCDCAGLQNPCALCRTRAVIAKVEGQ